MDSGFESAGARCLSQPAPRAQGPHLRAAALVAALVIGVPSPAVRSAPEIESEAGSGEPAPYHCDQPEEEGTISTAQNVIEETTCVSALWLDGLMGEGDPQAARRTSGYVETAVTWSQISGLKTRTKARVRMELPNWERRLSAFIGRDDEEEFVRDRTVRAAIRSEFPSVGEDDRWLAGLGYSLPGSKRIQTDLRLGVAGLSHPRVFLQGRGLLNVYSDDLNLVYLRSTLFWNSRLGFGTTFGADYNRLLSPRLLLRIAESGTVSQSSDGLDWTGATILYQKLDQDRGVSWEVFVKGETQAPEPLAQYGFRSTLRSPLIENRLIGEILGGYYWQYEDEERWEGSYLIGFGLTLPFGLDDE